MSIFRSNNPLEFAEVDGIIIDERSPSPSIQGVGTGTVILVGQFERGVHELTQITSIKAFHQMFGKSSFSGNVQLKNKKFTTLKVIRVEPTSAVKATLTVDAVITFTAKYKGVYGNKIKVTVEAGTVNGSKYTIEDTSTYGNELFPKEIYDNVLITSASTAFLNSSLVDVAVISTTAEPDPQVGTFLATGSEGALVDTDYESAIAKAAVEGSGNFLFLDVYNSTRNGYLKAHAAETEDKIVICAGPENETVSEASAAVALLRDTQGRIIYAYNWVKSVIDGVETYTSPASWYASLLSLIPAYVDPAYAGNSGFLYGITGLKKGLTRSEYILLMNAGISAFEFDSDIGFKIKSGVVTQIADSSKLMVFRRRMADYLTNSIGRFLKIYQNDVNKKEKRTQVKAAITAWVSQQEALGILPKDSEVIDGKSKLIDVESQNTNETIAQGKFFIIYKQRIFSSMRFIVLQAEIGESVVVKEQ